MTNSEAFSRYRAAIDALRHELGVEDDVLLDPLHVAASTDRVSRSCTAVCWSEGRLIGVMYATQRYVVGVGTGYAIGGDYCGRGLLLCRAEHEAAVLKAAIRRLMETGIHSLHLRMIPHAEARPELEGVKTVFLDAPILGDRMALASSFDDFLSCLGKHTRRNIRAYTRKALAAGIEFVPSLTVKEYEAGVERLNAETDFPAERLRLARDRRLMELDASAQRFGLRGPDGQLVAVLWGLTRGSRFHLMTQLNDANFAAFSLSIVLRGLVVEYLIGRGHTELQFMGGSSLSFGRFCTALRHRSIFVDKRLGFAALVKVLSNELVKGLAGFGREVPSGLQTLSNGFLEEWRLAVRSALGTSAPVLGAIDTAAD